MFTGIIEELGEVQSIRRSSQQACIQVLAATSAKELEIGDSIAVNGACLTVVKFGSNSFFADIMPETFEKTNLGGLRAGEKVNLEQALRVSDRVGGHFVLGHVDQVGVIQEFCKKYNAILFRMSLPKEMGDLVVPKGSIAVDGVSLTVLEVFNNSFTVSVIPHTAKTTTLGLKAVGARVNLEGDIIGKYVNRMMKNTRDSGSTLALLREFGYIDKGGAE